MVIQYNKLGEISADQLVGFIAEERGSCRIGMVEHFSEVEDRQRIR